MDTDKRLQFGQYLCFSKWAFEVAWLIVLVLIMTQMWCDRLDPTVSTLCIQDYVNTLELSKKRRQKKKVKKKFSFLEIEGDVMWCLISELAYSRDLVRGANKAVSTCCTGACPCTDQANAYFLWANRKCTVWSDNPFVCLCCLSEHTQQSPIQVHFLLYNVFIYLFICLFNFIYLFVCLFIHDYRSRPVWEALQLWKHKSPHRLCTCWNRSLLVHCGCLYINWNMSY